MAAAKLPPTQTPQSPAQHPKVEIRSRTGGGYSRAGHRWIGDWQDVPAEILRDPARAKLLQDDPHLDVRINGKRQPRFPGEVVAAEPSAAGSVEVESMKTSFRELEDRHDAALDEISELKTRLAKLESPERPNQPQRGGGGLHQTPSADDQSLEPMLSAEGQPSTPLAPTPPATEASKGGKTK